MSCTEVLAATLSKKHFEISCKVGPRCWWWWPVLVCTNTLSRWRRTRRSQIGSLRKSLRVLETCDALMWHGISLPHGSSYQQHQILMSRITARAVQTYALSLGDNLDPTNNKLKKEMVNLSYLLGKECRKAHHMGCWWSKECARGLGKWDQDSGWEEVVDTYVTLISPGGFDVSKH